MALFSRSPCSLSYTILWQGLLPLTELSICLIDGSREHAFQITGVWRVRPSGTGLEGLLGSLEEETFLWASVSSKLNP